MEQSRRAAQAGKESEEGMNTEQLRKSFNESGYANKHPDFLLVWAAAWQAAISAQPVSAGLTDAVIDSLWREAATGNHGDTTEEWVRWFARALLSAAQRDSQPDHINDAVEMVADTSADARDAARYRWLRDIHIGNDPESINLTPANRNGLNAAIDAAIVASKEAR
jgi:hypothetical protein